jgi:hypothetical protein
MKTWRSPSPPPTRSTFSAIIHENVALAVAAPDAINVFGNQMGDGFSSSTARNERARLR